MPASSDYYKQVELLVDVLPAVAKESSFALKGGTAINLFYQDMPRLSVDIDLTWLPVADRSSSLRNIDTALNRIAASIRDAHPGTTVTRFPNQRIGLPQIYVKRSEADIKIETSTTARGTVMPARMLEASHSATKQFGFITMNVASFEDVYAGKICAALERKHPRDLFDIMVLYENEGISDDLFRVFLVYIAASRRPIHESLAPTRPVRKEWYNDRFKGMSHKDVSLKSLVKTGMRLHNDVVSRLTGKITTFLLLLHNAEPDFSLIGLPDAVKLPAVRWKLYNLKRLKRENPQKHAEQRSALEQLFQ